MKKLARTIRFDESDGNVFARAAQPGEWAIAGGFEFSNWTQADLTGKARQAFSNGWLGLDSFGRATFVAVAQISEDEIAGLADTLARHFVTYYGAPDLVAATPVARDELDFMLDLCADHAPNTLLAVSRSLTDAGVSEGFRAIEPSDAVLDQVAIHGSLDEI